jgi:hypothetical protein
MNSENPQTPQDGVVPENTRRMLRTTINNRIQGLVVYFKNSKERCDNPEQRVAQLVADLLATPFDEKQLKIDDIKTRVVFFYKRKNVIITELHGILQANFNVCKKLNIVDANFHAQEFGLVVNLIRKFAKELAEVYLDSRQGQNVVPSGFVS